MIAKTLGFDLGDFIHTLGDAHLYTNHIDQAKLQITREPKKLPELVILNKRNDIFSYQFDDFQLKIMILMIISKPLYRYSNRVD